MRRAGAWLALLIAGLALPSSAWAAGPLEVDHPLVAQGRTAYEAGKYEDALTAFEAAKKERPDDAAVEYNRAVALAQLGRVAEAKSALQRVAESNQPELQQKAWYNLGNVHAGLGERKEALQSYRRALKLDPNDSLARHNYEVVLRNLPPPQQQGGPDGGTDGGSDGGSDGGRPDAGQDGGQKGDGGSPVDGGDGGSDAGSAPDGGADGGGADAGGDGGSDGGGQQGEGQGDGGSDAGTDAGSGEGEGEGTDGGADGGTESEEQTSDEVDAGMSPEDIDRQEAERLLDAMKQNEKNLQLWRFQQKKQRKPNEKDW